MFSAGDVQIKTVKLTEYFLLISSVYFRIAILTYGVSRFGEI